MRGTKFAKIEGYAIKGNYDKTPVLLKPFLNSKDKKERLEAQYCLGYIYFLQESYDKALKYFMKVAKRCEGHNSLETAGKCYQVIAGIYGRQESHIKAIENARKALRIFKDTNN